MYDRSVRRSTMIEKIISGGQTGVDQAALSVASGFGVSVGGWCPLGGLDENDESIFEKYPLKEVTGFSYKDSIAERTKRNIDDSDGTLIIVPSIPLPASIANGTLLTIEYAQKQSKPFLMVESGEKSWTVAISNWIQKHRIRVLNVAGPRESSCLGIHDQSYELLKEYFSSIVRTE